MKKRKGFTLAELLIVITVIGVLASMMMVSSNEAVSTARSTDLVANLNSLKGAALMHYVVSIDSYNKTDRAEDLFKIDNVTKYLDANLKDLKDNGYNVYEDASGRWFVGYVFNKNDTDILPKIAGRSKSLGLLKATREGNAFTVAYTNMDDDAMFFDGNGQANALAVAMLVR